MMVPTVLFFFRDFFWRSGLLEYWIRSYVRGHWFGCSLQSGTPLNPPCHRLPGGLLHLSFHGHWPNLFRRDDGNCSELTPGLMFDDFLPIPDAESLPFYPLELKLVVCVVEYRFALENPLHWPKPKGQQSNLAVLHENHDNNSTWREGTIRLVRGRPPVPSDKFASELKGSGAT